jgi:hypothetical protein
MVIPVFNIDKNPDQLFRELKSYEGSKFRVLHRIFPASYFSSNQHIKPHHPYVKPLQFNPQTCSYDLQTQSNPSPSTIHQAISNYMNYM